MPKPPKNKKKACAMQRGIFRSNPSYGKKWVDEFGDQCQGVPMPRKKYRDRKKNK